MNKFEELEAFVAVVEQHSFSNAGEKLGVAKSVLSRRVSNLEKRLGVQLMQRTTRKLSLTHTGQHFYQRAVIILADLNEAEDIVSDAQSDLAGKIKLATPMGLGINRLAKPLAAFMEQHPQIEIAIDLNDRQIDLIKEGFDVTVRIGELQDSSLIARKLASLKFAICASPNYLKKHGEPTHPTELSSHEVLIYSNVAAAQVWAFNENGKRILPRVKSRMSANNGDFLAQLACDGLGITSAPLFHLQAYIDRGELVPILTQFPKPEVGVYAVYPPGRMVPRRVKVFSDYLFEWFQLNKC